jgi:hypothetical protein
MFTRLTATVIISAPDASWAFTITAGEVYLPVPTISREPNDLPAMTRVSITSSTTDEIYNLDTVAVVDDGVDVRRSLEDLKVVLHRHAARIDFEPAEQLDDRQRTRKLHRIAVERDVQTTIDSNV